MTTDILNINQIFVWGIDLSQIGTVALILIMVTMGFTLKADDFKRILQQPFAVVIGLIAQLILLPFVAFCLVAIFQPSLPIAMGIIILSCCPSGATSNFFSYLARGNVAISISLTAVSGVIVIFTIPLLVNLATSLFAETAQQQIYLPVLPSMLRIFSLIVLPVIIGMAIRYRYPRLAVAIEPYATKLSFFILVLVMIAVLFHLQSALVTILVSAGVITLTLNLIMMIVGFWGALMFKLSECDARAVCIEVGVQNYLLSVVITIGLMQQPAYAVVPVIYLFVMYITVFSFIAYCRFYRDKRPMTSVVPPQ